MQASYLFQKALIMAWALLAGICIALPAKAQTYRFNTRESSQIKTASQIVAHNGLPDTLIVRQDKWDEIKDLGASWSNNLKFKQVTAFVKFAVDHAYPQYVDQNYTFRLAYDLYGYNNLNDTNSYALSTDTLTIGYNPDSLSIYQDLQLRKYSNYHKIMVVLKDVFEISSATSPPQQVNMGLSGGLTRLNFQVEASIEVQPYYKRGKGGSSYYPIYGPGSTAMNVQPVSMGTDHATMAWNLPGNTLMMPVQSTPANYELEWTYVDDYQVDPATNSVGQKPLSALRYNFRNNATRVVLDTNVYDLPLTYQRGYIVYRVRMVRPDSTYYRYPVEGPWSLAADSGSLASLSSNYYIHLNDGHQSDRMNWQYTVSFAERGRFKHVLSYYDGMLKNRQSITRFNTRKDALIATEQVYDYEGRPVISLLPTPMPNTGFGYQYNLTLNSATGLPYRPGDLDNLQNQNCPNEIYLPPLSYLSPAHRYYSPDNPDKTGVQAFVPDAEGYPLVHTIYEPGNDDRMQKQGGAGAPLQIANGHYSRNDYVGADQMELNRFFGTNIGWAGFYRKTVSKDPNGQYTVRLNDYKGRTVATSMVGLPDEANLALVANEGADQQVNMEEDHMQGVPQIVQNNRRSFNKTLFNEAAGLTSLKYKMDFQPYPVGCGKFLTAKAQFSYGLFDDCGATIAARNGQMGATGVTTNGSVQNNEDQLTGLPLEKGKYVMYKHLSIAPSEVASAVDQFMALPTSENCLKTEDWFIKQSVLSRRYPCPTDLGSIDECAEKELQMMHELWPNADSLDVRRKYGVYRRLGASVIGNGNSIFTLYCGNQPYNMNVVTPDQIRGETGGQTVPGNESAPYTIGNGPRPDRPFGPMGVFVINNQNDTLRCRYRYQDDCVQLPDNVIRFGQVYTQLKDLSVDTFMALFNDDIARALLPLHPEYCSLLACGSDSFARKLNAIPDGLVAEQLSLLNIAQMVFTDPLYAAMLAQPGAFPNAYDSLAKSLGGQASIQELALQKAYCQCNDLQLFQYCLDRFSLPISAAYLQDDAMKTDYFKALRDLYLANRSRFLYLLNGQPGAQPGCSQCQSVRMQLVPQPVFLQTFGPGGIATGPNSLQNAIQNAVPGQANALPNAINYLINVTAMTNFQAYADSVASLFQSHNVLLCQAAVDNVMEKLVNCGNNTALNALRAHLMTLCANGQVAGGRFSLQQIEQALAATSGLTIDDLCNPYLLAYDENMSYAQPAMPRPFDCKPAGFYADATSFFNGAPRNALSNLGASYYASLSPFNAFESELITALGGSGCQVSASLDLSAQYYELLFQNGSTQLRFYIRTGTGVCSQPLASAPYINVECISTMAGGAYEGLASGHIGQYVFGMWVQNGSNYCFLPMWNDAIRANQPPGNALAGCVPCTQMKDLVQDFQDEANNYQVYGYNHPHFRIMLRNYMNLKLRKQFSEDDYMDFINSCALGEKLYMRQYLAQYTYTFQPGQGHSILFANQLSAQLPNLPDVFYWWYTHADMDEIKIDLNKVPYNERRAVKNFVYNYSGPYTSRTLDELQDPNSNWLGVVCVDPSITLNTASIFGSYSNGFQLSYDPNPHYFWNGTSFATGYVHHIFRYYGHSPEYDTRNMYLLDRYLRDNNITAKVLLPIAPTYNDQYMLPEKRAYLDHVYAQQGQSVPSVLERILPDELVQQIPAFAYHKASYGHPARPDLTGNLYYAPASSMASGSGMSVLQTMLDGVKWHMQSLTGTQALAFNHSDSIAPNAQLRGFRCGDGAFWYRYFDGNDKIHNAYLRMPAYLDRQYYDHYVLDALSPNLGEGPSRSFHALLKRKSGSPAPLAQLELDGYTDFDLAANQRLNDVLLAYGANDPRPLADTVLNCERRKVEAAIIEGRERYIAYRDSVSQALKGGFLAHLMGTSISEKLIMGYKNQKFSNTLYYYDRAGNLARTVPPMGAYYAVSSPSSMIDSFRAHDLILAANNSKTSHYRYNSLDQVVAQETPDAGTRTFFYDAAGRPVFSQSAQQRLTGRMTYTLYDAQGRIEETGQALMACVPYFDPYPVSQPVSPRCGGYDPLTRNVTPYPNIVTQLKTLDHNDVRAFIGSLTREEVTYTHYDTAAMELPQALSLPQQKNLRARASCIKYFDRLLPYDKQRQAYDYAMHFDYDMAGNVATLVRDYPLWGATGQRFKRVDYDYDAISGKVNMISYNRGWPDQFYQAYAYDEDNRIVEARTSQDGHIWDRDAAYQYYLHGPLARTSLGDQRVQGLDYAYTVQGWLKALNGDLLATATDMGKDGQGASAHKKDAAALAIDYFVGDYKPIVGPAGSPLAAAAPQKSLYNGNIARATTAIMPFQDLATSYTYDQLNRIMRAEQQHMSRTDAALVPTDKHYSSYAYDADGNLAKIVRNGDLDGSRLRMDSLDYRYTYGSNKLANVQDHAADNYANDLRYHTGTMDRYLYDADGNTVRDLASGQDTIWWDHYGKATAVANGFAAGKLVFAHDGAGHRYLKAHTVEDDSGTREDAEYLVRDAQGNVLAAYKAVTLYKMGKRQWVQDAVEQVVGHLAMPMPTAISAHIVPALGTNAAFKAAMVRAVINSGWQKALAAERPVSFYMDNQALKEAFFSNTAAYPSFYQDLRAYSQNMGQDILPQAFGRALMDEGYINLANMVSGMYSTAYNTADIHDIFMMLAAGGACPVAQEVSAKLGMVAPADCGEWAQQLYDYPLFIYPMAEFQKAVKGKEGTPAGQQMMDFAAALVAHPGINANPAYQNLSFGASLFSSYNKALSRFADAAMLGAYLDQWYPARAVLEGAAMPEMMLDWMYDQDPLAFVGRVADIYGGNGPLYDAMAAAVQVPADVLSVFGTPQGIVHTVYERILQRQDVHLARHDIYGSARLGTKEYLPRQVYRSMVVGPGGVERDTNALADRKPWFGLETGAVMQPTAQGPYSAVELGAYAAQRAAGLRQYEIADHLGNVKATVTDLPALSQQAGQLKKGPAIKAAYDHYPFGMFMPGRYVQDSADRCMTVAQERWLTRWETVCKGRAEWPWQGDLPGGSAYVGPVDNYIWAYMTGSSQKASFRVDAPTVGEGMVATLEVAYVNQAAKVYVVEHGPSGDVLLAARDIYSGGSYPMMFVPSTGNITIDIVGPTDMGLYRLCFDKLVSEQQTVIVDVCDKVKDSYPYGYNGQEKVNEWAGPGNFLDFGARGLDTRIGRWLAVDPLAGKYPGLSPYNFVANSPMVHIDPDGKDYRLSIIKNNQGKTVIVSAHATVYLQGPGASQEMANNLNKEYQDKYSGYRKVDGVSVAFFVDYVYDGNKTKNEKNLDFGQNIFEVKTNLEKGYRSKVAGGQNKAGTKFYTGNSGIINSKSKNITKTIIHETLHFMGLSDRYDNFDNNLYQGAETHKGFDKDIMGGGNEISDVHYENLLNHAKTKNTDYVNQDNETYDRSSQTDLKNGNKPNTRYHEISTQAQGN